MKVKSGVYRLLYEKLHRKYSIEEYKEEVATNVAKIWHPKHTPPHDKKLKHRVFELLKIKNYKYFYLKYLEAHDKNEIDVPANIVLRILTYIGAVSTPSSINEADHIETRVNKLLEAFEKAHEDKLKVLTHNTVVPNRLKPVIQQLMDGKWWFCFRGHRANNDNDAWTLVYNVMTFEQTHDQKIYVSKLKRNQKEQYGNTYGYVDFAASTSKTLAINLTSEIHDANDEVKEHCHIKLNIELSAQTPKDLFLGEYMQHESHGHISSGSAILIQKSAVLADEGPEYMPFTPPHEPGHYTIPTNEPLEYLPIPFRHIAFYFKEKTLNSRRTTREEIFTLDDLIRWKEKRIK